jgi:hypothetical protein
MAGSAIPAGLGVRVDAANGLAAYLVIERSGAELVSALGDPDT